MVGLGFIGAPSVSCNYGLVCILLWAFIISSANSFTRLLVARPSTSRASAIWACCISAAFLRNAWVYGLGSALAPCALAAGMTATVAAVACWQGSCW